MVHKHLQTKSKYKQPQKKCNINICYNMNELWNVSSNASATICTMLYDSMSVEHVEIVIDVKVYSDEE